MNTSLDHLPGRKHRELALIVEVIREEFDAARKNATQQWKREGEIGKIVLFGSHARGDWVDNRISGYTSDYDLLVIVSHKKLTEFVQFFGKAEDRILADKRIRPTVTLIPHTLHEVNNALKEGQYFFTDIVKDGIAIYDPVILKGNGKRKYNFANPTPPDTEQAYKWAKDYYDLWMPQSTSFLRTAKSAVGNKDYKVAAFLLHQATEAAYNALLLTHTLYSPNSHNIKFLRALCEDIDNSLIKAWPRTFRRHTTRFETLKKAYIEARYSKHFSITREELEWLDGRVEMLLGLVETSCAAYLTKLKTNA